MASARIANRVMAKLFNWQSVSDRAADDAQSVSAVFSSSIAVNLILDALAVMIDRWRWESVDDTTWDTIEAAISLTIEELIANIVIPPDVFRDDFDRADGALGNGWAEDGDFLQDGEDTIVIINEWAIAPGNNPACALYETVPFNTNVEIRARVIAANDVDLGFFFRIADEFTSGVSGYGVRWGQGSFGVRVYRFENNSSFPVVDSNTSIPSRSTGDLLRITVQGDNIKVYITHASVEDLYIDYTDASPMERDGKVGMWIGNDGVAWDWVEIENL